MHLKLLKMLPILAATIAVIIWTIGLNGATAFAQCGCCQHGGGHGSHVTASAGHGHGDAAKAESAGDQAVPPHGGQLTAAQPLTFEVVYLPKEIRVYLFGVLPYSQSAKGVKGEISLQRPNDEKAMRVPLQYVAQPAGRQDYLSAAVDLSHVKDGDLVATVRLANLPLENHPGTTFTQKVVLSKAKLEVKLAALDQSDKAGIERQRVCPVTGAALGSMGDPIKVLVGEKPVYLCCKGCLGKVQKNPETYLNKATQASSAQ